MTAKNYDGISICDFKVRGNIYRKIQLFWVSAEGIPQRTVISLGNVRRLSSCLEDRVMQACKDFRKHYRDAVKKKQEFSEDESDRLKKQVASLKKELARAS